MTSGIFEGAVSHAISGVRARRVDFRHVSACVRACVRVIVSSGF